MLKLETFNRDLTWSRSRADVLLSRYEMSKEARSYSLIFSKQILGLGLGFIDFLNK